MKRILIISSSIVFLLLSCIKEDPEAKFLLYFKDNRTFDSRFFGYWCWYYKHHRKDYPEFISFFKDNGDMIRYSYEKDIDSYVYSLQRMDGKTKHIWGYLKDRNMLVWVYRMYVGRRFPKEGMIFSEKLGQIKFRDKDSFSYGGYETIAMVRVTDKSILEKLKNAKLQKPWITNE